MKRRPIQDMAGTMMVLLALLFTWTNPVLGQTFNSGSTGADGAFTPTCAPMPCTVTVALPPSGIFNFTTVAIPSGVTVIFAPNAANTPVTILATDDVTISSGAVLDVSGAPGIGGSTTGPTVNPGGRGGPGGFAGGQGGARWATNNTAAAGLGPGGGALPSASSGFCGVGGTYGAPTAFTALIPVLGGSGGGGQNGNTAQSGSSGGGGGGAIVMASSTRIVVSGVIRATGGLGGTLNNQTLQTAGSGSGGAIRLVAPQMSGVGTLDARSTLTGCVGGPGRVRLEASTLGFTGISNPTASTSTTPGPVTAASTPALLTVPTLQISAVGGAAAPDTTTGSYAIADVTLPAGTTNPVPVTLTVTNVPVGAVFSVQLIPQFSGPTTVTTTPTSGTFARATATANVSFPTGQVSVLTAFGSFTLPQLAGLFPFIDGEPIERITIAATLGDRSRVTLITRSGKEVQTEDILSWRR